MLKHFRGKWFWTEPQQLKCSFSRAYCKYQEWNTILISMNPFDLTSSEAKRCRSSRYPLLRATELSFCLDGIAEGDLARLPALPWHVCSVVSLQWWWEWVHWPVWHSHWARMWLCSFLWCQPTSLQEETTGWWDTFRTGGAAVSIVPARFLCVCSILSGLTKLGWGLLLCCLSLYVYHHPTPKNSYSLATSQNPLGIIRHQHLQSWAFLFSIIVQGFQGLGSEGF